MGNWIAYQSDVGMKYLVDRGAHEDRRAVGSQPGQRQRRPRHRQRGRRRSAASWSTRTTASTRPTPARCWRVAQRAKEAGAQAVYTNFYGTAPAQLQANLNQIDANAIVLNGSLGFSPEIPEQFGPSVEGLTSEVFTATWLSPDIPGVKLYMEAMSEYTPDMPREQLGAEAAGPR